MYTVVFESYRELYFIYLSHINDESNILSCHDHFIESLHAKKTSPMSNLLSISMTRAKKSTRGREERLEVAVFQERRSTITALSDKEGLLDLLALCKE